MFPKTFIAPQNQPAKRAGTAPRAEWRKTVLSCATAIALLGATSANAEVTIGVILSLTGPAASLGKPAENTVKLWPETIGGEKTKVIVLNDNSDPTEAAKQAAKLITEEKVDVLVGSSITPSSKWQAATVRPWYRWVVVTPSSNPKKGHVPGPSKYLRPKHSRYSEPFKT